MGKNQSEKSQTGPGRIELQSGELSRIIEEVGNSSLSESTKKLIIDILRSFVWMNQQLEDKKLTIKKLLRIFFGKKTEKDKDPLTEASRSGKVKGKDPQDDPEDSPKKGESFGLSAGGSSKGKGHGKTPSNAYKTAEHIEVPHPELKAGMTCPECEDANLYQFGYGSVLRIFGQPALVPKIYQPEQLRCQSCLAFFSAELPVEAGPERMHPSAKSIICLSAYSTGVPFYRLEKTQKTLGAPVSDATQWDCAEDVANAVKPVHTVLEKIGANGHTVFHDDTKNRIQTLMAENEIQLKANPKARTGIFTTGIVSLTEDYPVMLFYSGRRYAGENLRKLLEKRSSQLPLMQVGDASNCNFVEGFQGILIKCLDHGRRNFKDIEESFPIQCGHIIRELGKVYHNDAICKEPGVTPGLRLSFHQEYSAPIMEELKLWMEQLIEAKQVERNGRLGTAFRYMLKHWPELTQFLRVEGAPLSNAPVERLLKTLVIRRKNSLIHRTEVGAWVADILMSVIQTAIAAKANPFQYLTALQQHRRAVREDPERWLPWNYLQTLQALAVPS